MSIQWSQHQDGVQLQQQILGLAETSMIGAFTRRPITKRYMKTIINRLQEYTATMQMRTAELTWYRAAAIDDVMQAGTIALTHDVISAIDNAFYRQREAQTKC